MSVRTDDGRSVAFDLKDYDRFDHGYAATIHKAQGMTVDRVHVLAPPGMDVHSSYVVLSRHRDHVDLHYGRDDFADQKLVRTLSRDRSKDMASDYEQADPAQADAARSYAERRGITFKERVIEIVRQVPEKVRGIFDGLRLSPSANPDAWRNAGERKRPERERQGVEAAPRDVAAPKRSAGPEREMAAENQEDLHAARTKVYAKAVDDIFAVQEMGGTASPEHVTALNKARDEFDKVRPCGWRDAEATHKKNPELAYEAAGGKVIPAIRRALAEARPNQQAAI